MQLPPFDRWNQLGSSPGAELSDEDVEMLGEQEEEETP